MMNKLFLFSMTIFMFTLMGCENKIENQIETETSSNTYINPLDINYRFQLEAPSRREAADPTIVWFRDRYYLFASKSGGYWHSQNLGDWKFIETNEIPTEEYAPTAVQVGDTLYFLASSNEKSTLYKSSNPLSGKWEVVKEALETPVWDPALFLDDDGKLYLFWGCSNINPLYGVELDYKNDFTFVGEPSILKYPNPENFGWEVPGDYNTLPGQAPWIEGAWVNKYNGKYYLQYSGPGTEFKSYSDGVYVADHPLGPYEPQAHNPFAYKPEGFAAGAGHGNTFQDQYGNYWHIGTMTISQKHMFERRLGLWPAFFDQNGTLYADTRYGDYPVTLPDKKIESFEEIFPQWMLLSYHKPVGTSSAIDSLSPANLVDEDIRSYWAAESGDAGEYVKIDLEDTVTIQAMQINFAEHNTQLFGRFKDKYHRFTVEVSKDDESWFTVIDHSESENDQSHRYFDFEEPVKARFVRIVNHEVPDGNFALSGFRIFGKGNFEKPEQVKNLSAIRDANDARTTYLKWLSSKDAIGYTIRYGTVPDKLYHSYQVYEDTAVTIRTLNSQANYYYTVEAFNENGISAPSELAKDF